MVKRIANELKRHAPFTAFGAVTGIIVMVAIVFGGVSSSVSEIVFDTLHPAHIILSALVTTAIYRLYRRKVLTALLVGYIGSVGICTLSDIVLPYLGGVLIGAEMEFHLCFIEEWWLVNPSAFLGIAIGFWRPNTRLFHAGHVLVSTWASLFYLTSFGVVESWVPLLPLVFIILFVAVWFPCCLSDIIFPLLFVGSEHDHNVSPDEEHRHLAH
ncbi:MAG: hypothetical protein IBX36_02310 [Dehalococcoidia bacterium]|nr:hypothetical protein [Dehalococcoidia bacterium]